MVDKSGWRIAKSWGELVWSTKHLIRDGMLTASDAEIIALVEAAEKELLRNDYHAYYKMYLPLTIALTRQYCCVGTTTTGDRVRKVVIRVEVARGEM